MKDVINIPRCLVILMFFYTIATVSSSKRISRHHRGRDDTNTKPIFANDNSLFPDSSKGEGGKICEGWWCGLGKECVVSPLGMPQCDCIVQCPLTHLTNEESRVVCGSDGNLYRNRCELHRNACLRNQPLTVDRSGTLCQDKDHEKRDENESDENDDTTGEEDVENSDAKKTPHFYATYTKEIFSPPVGVAGKFPESELKSQNSNESEGKLSWVSSEKKEEKVKWKEDKNDWVLSKPMIRTFDKLGENSMDEDDEDSNEEEEDELEDLELSGSESTTTQETPGTLTANGNREIKKDSSVTCSPQEYEILKDSLLLYSHERLIGGVETLKKTLEARNEEDPEVNSVRNNNNHVKSKNSKKFKEMKKGFDEGFGDGPEAGKDYLLSLMFSHFDQNNNGALEFDELLQVGEDRNFKNAANGCRFVDLLHYDDLDHNDQLNINEFYTAFNKLYSVSVISLDKALEVTQVRATVGDNMELRCDITGSPPIPIVWKRYGLDLSTLNQEEQIRVFSDGTLFLNKIQLLHAGNYTCQAQRNDKVLQTHVLTVQTLPDVKVTPHIVWEKPGEEVTMECRVMGEPFPTVK